MKCGYDTHGGKVGEGCGHRFGWKEAKRYESSVKYEPISVKDKNNIAFLQEVDHVKAKAAIIFALDVAATDVPEDKTKTEILKAMLMANQTPLDVKKLMCMRFGVDDAYGILHIVCMNPSTSVDDNSHACKFLLQLGAGIEMQTESIKPTIPLMLASRCGNLGVIQVLLAGGANVNAKDKSQATALAVAVKSDLNDERTKAVCELLCKGGAVCDFIADRNNKPKTVSWLKKRTILHPN